MTVRVFTTFVFIPFLVLIIIPSIFTGIYQNYPVKTIINEVPGDLINFFLGQNFSFSEFIFLNEGRLSRKILQEYPLVKEVTIQRFFPNNLQIKGFPREILIIISYNEDKYLLDLEGKIIRYKPKEPLPYHIITIKSSYFVTESNLNKIGNNLYILELSEVGILEKINQIELFDPENLLIQFINGCIVKVPISKLVSLSQNILSLYPLHGENTILDFRFNNIIVIKKDEESK